MRKRDPEIVHYSPSNPPPKGMFGGLNTCKDTPYNTTCPNCDGPAIEAEYRIREPGSPYTYLVKKIVCKTRARRSKLKASEKCPVVELSEARTSDKIDL